MILYLRRYARQATSRWAEPQNLIGRGDVPKYGSDGMASPVVVLAGGRSDPQWTADAKCQGDRKNAAKVVNPSIFNPDLLPNAS